MEQVKEIKFKGYRAAEGAFMVDENVAGSGKIIQQKIKRIVVFTGNDLWNIIFAPSQYYQNMKVS